MKWSQAVCASILIDGLYPPAWGVPTLGVDRYGGRFESPYLIFAAYVPDNRSRSCAWPQGAIAHDRQLPPAK